jgi:hypothetical protein
MLHSRGKLVAKNAHVSAGCRGLRDFVPMANGAVRATRDILDAHATGFNDALTWEIHRHRAEIFEKLKLFFVQVKSGGSSNP